jgi:tetratricopeptide (TPR) repeat protein
MVRPRLWLALFPLFVVLLIPHSAAAQKGGQFGGNRRISVQVRLPDGSAAPSGVLVELELQDTEMVEQQQTDSSGKCAFTPGDPAIYLVRAKQAGYYDAVVAVDLQNTPTGIAMLVLRPIPGEAEAPPSPPKGSKGTTVSAADLAVPPAAHKEFDLSRQALLNHDLEGGIAHLKKAIEIHDQFPQAYTMLGMAYNEQKKWKEGQSALEKAIQENPKAAEAYVQLGSALIHQKDFAGAEKALNQGLQLDPGAQDSPMVHYTLATAYFTDGHWRDAEPHAAKTIAAHPEFAMAHWLMAQIMLKKGDGQGAINEFQTYLKLDPNGPAAPAVRAVIPKIQAAIQRQ